ncbi:MAG: hypothetical protein ACREFP_07710 [Acetobacteraceae bacterium]
MRIRFIAVAAALLFGLGACAGGFSSGVPSGNTGQSSGASASGMGGHGGY